MAFDFSFVQFIHFHGKPRLSRRIRIREWRDGGREGKTKKFFFHCLPFLVINICEKPMRVLSRFSAQPHIICNNGNKMKRDNARLFFGIQPQKMTKNNMNTYPYNKFIAVTIRCRCIINFTPGRWKRILQMYRIILCFSAAMSKSR